MKSRLQEFDILRVVAAFSVIMIHISALYINELSLAYYLNQIVRYAVPLFIIMSGFLIQFSMTKKPPLSAKHFYQQRFSKLLIPYIFWSIFYSLFNFIYSTHAWPTPDFLKTVFGHMLWGTASYHLYFMIIIFQLYLIYPVINKLWVKKANLILVSSFLVTFLSQFILYLDMYPILNLPPAGQKLYLVIFPVWIFFLIWGMYLADNNPKISVRLKQQPVKIFLVFGLSFLLLLLDSKYTASYATSIRPTVIIYTISSFLAFYLLALHYKKPLPSVIGWLANQSFLIFLIHPFILSCLIILPQYIGLAYPWFGILGMISLYIFTVIFTLISVLVISTSPLAAYLGAYPKN